jgi:hypothetical protein
MLQLFSAEKTNSHLGALMLRRTSLAIAAVCVLLCESALAQTEIKVPKNNYTPQQDVEIGLQAAGEIRKQYPVIRDKFITGYLTEVGHRLLNAAPPELNRKEFRYSFSAVNVKEINAFALPGGPTFVTRGMFEAAEQEGEIAGVMAHELSHVLLRHGTANATKAQNPWLQLGQLAGVIGGSIVGGTLGSVIATGTDFGLGTLMLRYSRDFEKQADLLGSQIMARAGYDPRDLARMFETIERQSGGRGPEWLSSHPNPGNRTAYINQEAAMLHVASTRDTGDFEVAQSRFGSQPRAKSMAEVERNTPSAETPEVPSAGTPGRPVPAPSTRYRTVTGGNVFRANVPDNWTTLGSRSAIKVVPNNGYGDLNGQTVFTHGVEFGVTPAGSRDLEEATRVFLSSIARSNPKIRMSGEEQMTRLSGRSALHVPLVNPSPLGGQEDLTLTTVFLADGSLFYFLTVVPERDASAYNSTFRRILGSIRLTGAR